MSEQELIGNQIEYLLDNYEVHLPPLRRDKATKWYEINCFYKGEHIIIYEYYIHTALQKWENVLKSNSDK